MKELIAYCKVIKLSFGYGRASLVFLNNVTFPSLPGWHFLVNLYVSSVTDLSNF